MPAIDISELLVDPDFVETITVTRTPSTVDNLGETNTVNQTTLTLTAVVMPQEGNHDFQPESEYVKNTIEVYTQTRLLGVSETTLPDVVNWLGNKYKVLRCNNYSNWGAGFTKSVCEIADTVLAQ